MSITLKVTFNSLIKRTTLNTSVSSFPLTELWLVLQRLFPTEIKSSDFSLVLKYKDDEQDLICLENDEDLAHALGLSTTLNLTVSKPDLASNKIRNDFIKEPTKSEKWSGIVDDLKASMAEIRDILKAGIPLGIGIQSQLEALNTAEKVGQKLDLEEGLTLPSTVALHSSAQNIAPLPFIPVNQPSSPPKAEKSSPEYPPQVQSHSILSQNSPQTPQPVVPAFMTQQSCAQPQPNSNTQGPVTALNTQPSVQEGIYGNDPQSPNAPALYHSQRTQTHQPQYSQLEPRQASDMHQRSSQQSYQPHSPQPCQNQQLSHQQHSQVYGNQVNQSQLSPSQSPHQFVSNLNNQLPPPRDFRK